MLSSWRFKADADNHILAANVPSGDATACAFVMQSVNTGTFAFPFGFDDNSTAANATNYYFETNVDGKSMSISWRNTVAASGTSAVIVVMVPFWWYFMCLRRSGTTLTGFIRRVGSGHWFRQSTTTSGIITPTRFLVGGDAAVLPGEFWNGRVAAPRLWNLGLTESEIEQESYQLAPVSRPSGLVGAWLDEGYDTHGKSRILTKGTATVTLGPPGVPRFRNQRSIKSYISAPAGGVLAGQADILFGAGASVLTGAGALAGASNILFGATDTLSGAGQLVGTATITFDAQGVLQGAGTLAGAASITFGGVDPLVGAGALAGAAAITFGGAAAPDLASSPIDGSASITFTGTGVLQGIGALAGVASISFGGQAVPDGASPVVAAENLTKHVLRRGSLQGKVMRRG